MCVYMIIVQICVHFIIRSKCWGNLVLFWIGGDRGTLFSIHVQINFELGRLILGFGDSIEVLQPQRLRERMQEKLRRAVAKYS